MSSTLAWARSSSTFSDTNSLAEAAAADRAPTPPPQSGRRAGSSAAAGTRNCGPDRVSRPRPSSTPWSATGRSGWSGSTAMRSAGEQRGDARGGRHRRDAGPGRRPDRARRPRADSAVVDDRQGTDRAPDPPAAGRDRALARAQEILLGYGLTTVGSTWGRRPMRLERCAPRRRRRHAQRADPFLPLGDGNRDSPSPAPGRPGYMTGGCAWWG